MSDQAAIYVHIPFCVKKCIYCDFYSKTNLSLIPDYVKSLQKEIERRAGPKEKISSIYFGGGTPSLLTIKDIDLTLQTISDRFLISRNVEVSLEVNPGTIDLNYLRELKKTGINRLSIGVQSFNDDKLKFLGRIHTAEQAVRAIDAAENGGELPALGGNGNLRGPAAFDTIAQLDNWQDEWKARELERRETSGWARSPW